MNNEDARKQRLSYKISEYWGKIDENYIKPIVIHDYPYTVDEHEEISKGIKLVEETRRKKKKSKQTLGSNISTISKK